MTRGLPGIPALLTPRAPGRGPLGAPPQRYSGRHRPASRLPPGFDHVGCRASRSMRLTICRNRRCVKSLSA